MNAQTLLKKLEGIRRESVLAQLEEIGFKDTNVTSGFRYRILRAGCLELLYDSQKDDFVNWYSNWLEAIPVLAYLLYPIQKTQRIALIIFES